MMPVSPGRNNAHPGKEHRKVNESSLMHGWAVILGSLAMIAIFLEAFGPLLGIARPADAPARARVIQGMAIVLMIIPSVIVSAWSGLSVWQRLGPTMIEVIAHLVLRPPHQPNNRHGSYRSAIPQMQTPRH
jgi:hypothetical protein